MRNQTVLHDVTLVDYQGECLAVANGVGELLGYSRGSEPFGRMVRNETRKLAIKEHTDQRRMSKLFVNVAGILLLLENGNIKSRDQEGLSIVRESLIPEMQRRNRVLKSIEFDVEKELENINITDKPFSNIQDDQTKIQQQSRLISKMKSKFAELEKQLNSVAEERNAASNKLKNREYNLEAKEIRIEELKDDIKMLRKAKRNVEIERDRFKMDNDDMIGANNELIEENDDLRFRINSLIEQIDHLENANIALHEDLTELAYAHSHTKTKLVAEKGSKCIICRLSDKIRG